VATYLVRVELPDRPGALGAVASRIGAVRADVTAVEIVERRQGSAVDEFIVELADEGRLALLLSEIIEVDGVSVEEVHLISGRAHDRRLDAYDTAIDIMQERTPHDVLTALASRVSVELDAAWTAVVDVEQVLIVAAHGRPPAAAWLAAFVAESRAERALQASNATPPPPGAAAGPGAGAGGAGAGGAGAGGAGAGGAGAGGAVAGGAGAGAPEGGDTDEAQSRVTAGRTAAEGITRPGPDAGPSPRPETVDIGWVELAAWDLVLAAGRPGLRFGSREQAHLAAVARLADARWVDLAEREARVSHPSCSG